MGLLRFLLDLPPRRCARDEPGFQPCSTAKTLPAGGSATTDSDGKTDVSDGRFKVQDGTIVITGVNKPGQAKMEAIDTVAVYRKNFILRLEFRAGRDANSGLHLGDREFKHQLQIRDYPAWGRTRGSSTTRRATGTPSR